MRKRNTLPTSPPSQGSGVLGPVLGAADSVTKPADSTPEPAMVPIAPIETNAPNSTTEAPLPRKTPDLQGIAGGQAKAAPESADLPKAAATSKSPPKERRPFYISRDVIEEARGAVEALLGTEHRISLNLLAENALKRELKRLSKAHNDGEPFSPPMRDLPVGRQMGR